MKLVLSLILVLLSLSTHAGPKPVIAEWPSKVQPLLIGAHIPNITLWTGNGDPVHLRKLVRKKPTVIIFYQGNWSPYCEEQLSELKTLSSKLKKIGFQLVAISPDSPYKLLKSRKKGDLNYLLVIRLSPSKQACILVWLIDLIRNKQNYSRRSTALSYAMLKVKTTTIYRYLEALSLIPVARCNFNMLIRDVKSQLPLSLLHEAAKMVDSKLTKKKRVH